MLCHKCEFGRKIQSGEAKGMAYENTPCASCDGSLRPELVMEYDDNRATSAPAPATTDGAGEGRLMPVGVLTEAVKLILSMRPTAFAVVRLRYLGNRFSEIAASLGCTAEEAEKRFNRVVRAHAPLRQLFAAVPLAKLSRDHRRSIKNRIAGTATPTSAAGDLCPRGRRKDQPRESAKRGAAGA